MKHEVLIRATKYYIFLKDDKYIFERSRTMDCIWTPISEIEDGLFLGGIPDPRSDDEDNLFLNANRYQAPHFYIYNLNLDFILSITDVEVNWNLPVGIDHYHLVFPDRGDIPILYLFERIVNRIHIMKEQGKKIFIHCHAGVSRSCTALAAYYLKYGIPGNRYPDVDEALDFIRGKRCFINPNKGFLDQLSIYREKLRLERTASVTHSSAQCMLNTL